MTLGLLVSLWGLGLIALLETPFVNPNEEDAR
jgi:hypothetical protein